jgi:UDP-glucose 4-epimerase
VVLSSAAVYGNAQTLPISENAVLAPISPYGYHKCMVEQMGQEFWRVYGLPVVFGRIFSAYGAGLRRQVVWDILQKAQHSRAQGEPFCLSGTGDETRDFIHVSDVARALLCLLDHADMRATAYNIASGLSVTIRTLAQLIVRRMASPSPITFDGQIRPGDPLYWQADVSALAALGFRCEVDLATGLGEYDIGNGQT